MLRKATIFTRLLQELVKKQKKDQNHLPWANPLNPLLQLIFHVPDSKLYVTSPKSVTRARIQDCLAQGKLKDVNARDL